MPSASQGYATPLNLPNPFPGNTPQQGGPYFTAGVPSSGTSCVQTLTIGGTPTGGGFTLLFGGQSTGFITWSATDATLEANIAAALNGLTTVGPSGVAVTAGTGSSGIGTYLITFQAQNEKLTVPAILPGRNQFTGTNPTLAVAVTTVGVTATLRGCLPGTRVANRLTGLVYRNTGTPTNPTWTNP